jgi:hypothetical protein
MVLETHYHIIIYRENELHTMDIKKVLRNVKLIRNLESLKLHIIILNDDYLNSKINKDDDRLLNEIEQLKMFFWDLLNDDRILDVLTNDNYEDYCEFLFTMMLYNDDPEYNFFSED